MIKRVAVAAAIAMLPVSALAQTIRPPTLLPPGALPGTLRPVPTFRPQTQSFAVPRVRLPTAVLQPRTPGSFRPVTPTFRPGTPVVSTPGVRLPAFSVRPPTGFRPPVLVPVVAPRPVTPPPVTPPPVTPPPVTPPPPTAQPMVLGSLTLMSHRLNDPVDDNGATFIATVRTPANVKSVSAVINPGNRTVTPDVNPTSGQFAIRLFDENVNNGAPVTLAITITFADDTTEVQTVTLAGRIINDGLEQVLGRLSFGANPALYNTVRQMGFDAWVNQQLAPQTIPDTAFTALNVDSLFTGVNDLGQYSRRIVPWRIAYAAYSEKQLQEVMTQFWINHFWMVEKETGDYRGIVRDARLFRQNAFGRFRDLLDISAKNSVMMRYLDNNFSNKNGFNINYARELLELHTVGVNGGYIIDDINAVANIMTGWTFRRISPDGAAIPEYEFFFDVSRHNTSTKVVPFINETFVGIDGPNGIQEGERLLDILAMHPETMKFVCGKLINALVVDGTPPADFLNQCTTTWAQTQGNMGAIVRAMITNPNYRTVATYQRNKGKTPLEFAVGYIRTFGIYPATGRTVDFFDRAQNIVERAGMEMLTMSVPTGFKEDAASWTTTASMIEKFRTVTGNFVTQGTNSYINHNYQALITGSGMDTAQGMAAYLLAIATADRFRMDEFDAVVAELKGADGLYNARQGDESAAVRRAIGLIVTLPSYQLQ